MVTQITIDNLFRKADSKLKKEAVSKLQRDYDNYRMAVVDIKNIKPPSGYATSSQREMYHKSKFRNENIIKTLKLFLNQVGWNKSASAIYLYIINGPTGSTDYYHGVTEGFMPFSGSEWKKRIVIKAFRDKFSYMRS